MQQDLTQVAIPSALHRRVEAVLDRLGQPSVDAFVAHAVRTALASVEATLSPSAEDEAQIVERLRRLGYID
jgi:hypothetical protein